ncbi:phenoloxidase-activating factor 2-like [Episyrphus balteatus]|uniref:phenoloxidase-activating factor 2-like n=1 Tax=Episyrphus balteatus TaxID=286459 RepID=UPI0024852A92|nr:phenoloxidase-activating factor 2-like [Episyrphus balteatus]
MNAKLILIPIFLIGSCVAQNHANDILNDVLNDVFPSDQVLRESNFETIDHPVTTVAQKNIPRQLTGNSFQPCGTRPDMVCVRKYLCKNGKVNIYGTYLIEPRMGSDCNIGLKTCCEISDKPILNPIPIRIGCGYRNKNGVGIKVKELTDDEAEFGEFPWMVLISEKMTSNGKVVKSPKCGGSLIAPTVVLTGAHCVNTTQILNYRVRAGEWESNSNAEPYPHQDRQVVEIIMHENFNAENLKNNIALLFLESPFDEAPHIKTVCLPPVNTNFDMSRCFTSSWEMKQFETGKYPKIMKKIELPVVPNAKCQNDLRQTRLGPLFKLHSSFMCAGGEIGKDTCKGNGGSPLVCPMANNPDRYYQVGVVSWGIGCGDKNVPGVYANIPHLRSWIDEQLANKEIDAKYFTILERNISEGKVVSSFKCGGSLIAPTVVLTGAHCVNSFQALNYKVRAGEWESNSNAELYPHQDRQVVEIIMHENFNAENLKNNIALLFLKTAFDAAPHIKTVCLPPVNTNFDMSRCFTSGWEMKQFGTGKYPKIMKKIELPVVPNAKCQNDLRQTPLGPLFKLHSSFMCAGGEHNKDTCSGDEGSPLVCPMANNPDRYYQVGIVSWGIGCGGENVPGVYANIPHLRSWIDEQLANRDIDVNFFTP